MRIIVDNREHDLIEKFRLIISNDPNLATLEVDTLPIGDILFKTDEGKDVLLIERKSLSDLISSIKDGRYEEQSHRLKYASGFSPHNIVYLIEGMFSTLKTPIEKKLVLSSITSLLYFKGFSTIRTSGLQETAELIIYMADKIDRNMMKGVLPWYLSNEQPEKEIESYSGLVKKIKKDNITPENMSEILLRQIPGISTLYAKSILNKFGGFSVLLENVKANTASFEDIYYETKGKKRRIPKSCGEEIIRFFKEI